MNKMGWDAKDEMWWIILGSLSQFYLPPSWACNNLHYRRCVGAWLNLLGRIQFGQPFCTNASRRCLFSRETTKEKKIQTPKRELPTKTSTGKPWEFPDHVERSALRGKTTVISSQLLPVIKTPGHHASVISFWLCLLCHHMEDVCLPTNSWMIDDTRGLCSHMVPR